jgi:hydroxymethylpyrimidine/phosphomethylpyrimidine kinase
MMVRNNYTNRRPVMVRYSSHRPWKAPASAEPYPVQTFLAISDRPQPHKTPVALTIAGFDPSGGAGITADIQVFAAHGIYGIAAITAQTVQSTLGVVSVHPTDPALLSKTLANLSADLPPGGVKIGMLADIQIVNKVRNYLRPLRETQGNKAIIPIVLDPILQASSGAALITGEGSLNQHKNLLPLVDWLTPNWSELSGLTGYEVHSIDSARAAANLLAEAYPHLHIVVTGGDQGRAIDLLRTPDGHFETFDAPKIESNATHGTGCAFSSALLANLMRRHEAGAAVFAAKEYVSGAIRYAPGLGSGRGPLNFFWRHDPAAQSIR